MNRTPFFSVESDTLGTLRVSGAISYSNAASALARMPLETVAEVVSPVTLREPQLATAPP